MNENLKRLEDATRRLNIALNDQNGRGMLSWVMMVDGLMTEVKDLINKVKCGDHAHYH